MDKIEQFKKLATKAADFAYVLNYDDPSSEIWTVRYCIDCAAHATKRIEDYIMGNTPFRAMENVESGLLEICSAALRGAALLQNRATDELAKEITELYRRKNADYGDSFNRSLDRYGFVAAFVRMGDKLNRLNALVKLRQERKVKDESVTDTLLDLASYAIMTRLWMQENKLEDGTLGLYVPKQFLGFEMSYSRFLEFAGVFIPFYEERCKQASSDIVVGVRDLRNLLQEKFPMVCRMMTSRFVDWLKASLSELDIFVHFDRVHPHTILLTRSGMMDEESGKMKFYRDKIIP